MNLNQEQLDFYCQKVDTLINVIDVIRNKSFKFKQETETFNNTTEENVSISFTKQAK